MGCWCGETEVVDSGRDGGSIYLTYILKVLGRTHHYLRQHKLTQLKRCHEAAFGFP